MKNDLEKIKELKEKYNNMTSFVGNWFYKKLCEEAKAIREKAEDGCEEFYKRFKWSDIEMPCSEGLLCPTCEEIIKICKEIER